MRERIYNFGSVSFFFLCFSLLFVQQTASAEPRTEYTKTIQREFSTTPDGKVELSNKYGRVQVNTWAENRVKIDVTIVVNAKNQTEADNAFNRISVNFMNMVGHVKAETVIEEQKQTSWWGWSSSGSSCQDFRINYVVWMPKKNALYLDNKYGDSDVASLDGRLDAMIKYGNIKVDNLSQKANVTVGYGKARLGDVQDLDVKLGYGELDVQTSNSVSLDSKYSEIAIKSAKKLTWDSRYDDFRMGDVDILRLDAAYSDGSFRTVTDLDLKAVYSDLRVEAVTGSIDVDMDYCDLKVTKVGRNFSKININSDYSDFSCGTEDGVSYSFDVEGSYTDMRFNSKTNFSTEDKQGTRKRYRGSVGSGGGVVRARMTYGELKFY